jgi:hypothetical protein
MVGRLAVRRMSCDSRLLVPNVVQTHTHCLMQAVIVHLRLVQTTTTPAGDVRRRWYDMNRKRRMSSTGIGRGDREFGEQRAADRSEATPPNSKLHRFFLWGFEV